MLQLHLFYYFHSCHLPLFQFDFGGTLHARVAINIGCIIIVVVVVLLFFCDDDNTMIPLRYDE